MSHISECHIISAGEFHGISNPIHENDYVIAVDGGYTFCQNEDITPHLLIGDFDSLSTDTIPDGIVIKSFPKEKDDTDTMLAVKEGLSLGYQRFHLHACSGGRLDHSFANLQTLLFLSMQNAQGFLYTETECFTVITANHIQLHGRENTVFSVFAMSDKATGVTIQGSKYSIQDHTLHSHIPLGVSNAFIGKPVVISVREGSLLISWEYQ